MTGYREPRSAPDSIMVGFFDDPKTSMAVIWRTDTKTESCRVAFRPADGSENAFFTFVEGRSRDLKTDDGDLRLWSVHLRGLEPGQRYIYRVENTVTGENSDDYSFRTEPEDCRRFKFLCVSDFQKGDPWERPDYSDFNRFMRKMLALHPDTAFILSAGDNSDCGEHEQQWKGVMAGFKDIAESVPIMMAEGNHDTRGFADYKNYVGRYYSEPAALYCAHFRDLYPFNGPVGWETENLFFDYGPARFVLMGVNAPETVRDWAIDALDGSDALWKIGAYHFPICYSGADCQNYDAYPVMREAFERFNLVFSGHEHNFARSFPLKDEELFDEPSKGTIHYMLANSNSNPPGTRSCQKVWHAAYYADELKLPACAVVEVDGPRMTLTSVLGDGRVFDRCVIDLERDTIEPPALAPQFRTVRMFYKGAGMGLAGAATQCEYAPAEALTGPGDPPLCGALAVLIRTIGGDTVLSPGKCRLGIYGKSVELTEGSDIALADGEEIRLPCRVWRGARGQLYAPFDALAPLGMRWAYSKRNNFVSVEHESEDKPVPEQP